MQKIKRLRDKKYRDSFKIMDEHHCILTDTVMPDGAHVRYGCYSAGMKPSDYFIIPLSHDLHLQQHVMGEVEFWREHYDKLPAHLTSAAIVQVGLDMNDEQSLMRNVKRIAFNYYSNWLKQRGLPLPPLPGEVSASPTLIGER